MQQRNTWLRIASFIIGYNYRIVANCSELTAKRVKRYMSAMCIVMVIWALVGFAFSDRYLEGELIMNFVASLLMIFLVVQIERQIILSTKANRTAMAFRGVIGVLMAFIGAVIIDQIIFREDVDQKKMELMDAKVRRILPGRAEELRRQIRELDSTILVKEGERKELLTDISNHPTITVFSRSKVTSGNSGLGADDSSRVETVTRSSSQIQNPKMALVQPIDDQVSRLRTQKLSKDSALLALRPAVEDELKEKNGFLDELDVLARILGESYIALGAWIIWFALLIFLELFILMTKINEEENDYDAMLKHQMQIHLKRLALLGGESGPV